MLLIWIGCVLAKVRMNLIKNWICFEWKHQSETVDVFLFARKDIMEVKINQEIRNYTESMFFGLSLRQFIFSVLARVVVVGLYFLLKPHLGTETVSWVCILEAAPFAALGFVKYNGMTAKSFYGLLLSRNFLSLRNSSFISLIFTTNWWNRW